MANTVADLSTGAGTYTGAITVSGGSDENYIFSYTPADFEITKADLTVTAQSKNKCYDGQVYAGLNSVTYSGFVNGDNESTLGGELEFSGTYSSVVDQGSYTIIPEGLTSDNYNIIFQNGSLEINPLPTATISGDAQICAGSFGSVSIELTGQAPWSLTITDGTTSQTINDISENSYMINVSGDANTSKTYSISNVSDFNGCSNTGVGTAVINVKANITAGTISGDQLIAPGASPSPIISLTEGSGDGTIAYSWESSVDEGLNWTTIPNATGTSYSPLALNQPIWYRRIAISAESSAFCTAASDTVKINIWPTGIDNPESKEIVWSAYPVRNTEISLKGTVSNGATARLFDIQGRAILIKNLEEGSLNIIPVPNLKTGVYMLFVKDNERLQGFKIPIKE
jgi:hypothetical protein